MLSSTLMKVASQIYSEAGTWKVRNSMLTKLRGGDFYGIVSCDIDPRAYTDARVFRKDYQCATFLKKIQIDIPTIDRRRVAVENFWASERQCWDTNQRFKRFAEGGSITPAEARALSVLDKARGWLKNVLGAIPLELEGRFGPGVSAEVRGPAATVPDKLQSRASSTPGVRDLLPLAYRSRLLGQPGRQTDPNTVRGNVFETVPKDAKKDRGICIEPGLNVWFQLGAGGVIRERLKAKANIVLETAQPIHRQWAQQASQDGLKATIDLSNASDTVAYELVRWLLPADWFCLLDSLRSPVTHLSDEALKLSGTPPSSQRSGYVRLEKFSSMGNGFTFELETLIFLSICHALGCGVSGVDYRVYGDDIIVDTEDARGVLAALRFCGFTPNPRKTFVDGWFRESCGGDYFKGLDVTPCKASVDPCFPHEWFALANSLRSRAPSGMRGVGFCYTSFFQAWLSCFESLPECYRRLRGPDTLGDLVIHDHEYEIDRKKGYGRVRVLKPVPRRTPLIHWSTDVVMAFLIYTPDPPLSERERDGLQRSRLTPQWPFSEKTQQSLGVTPRNAVTGYKIGYVAYG